MGKRKNRDYNTITPPEDTQLTPELGEIYSWLQNVQFKRLLLGGVDEADVWRKFEELNALYEKAIIAERERYRGSLNCDRSRSAERMQEGEEHDT